MKASFDYSGDRDIEMWIISGDGFSIPLNVRYGLIDGAKHAHLLPSLPLGFSQISIIEGRVTSAGGFRMRTGWGVPEEFIEKNMTKAQGLTPEFYFIWNGEKAFKSAGASEPVSPPKRPELKADPMIREAADKSGLDFETLSLAWMAILQVMPGWLLSGKQIQLGFCRLVALPYRINWIDLLLARMPQLRRALLVPGATKMMSILFSPASRGLRATELTEYRSRRGHSLFMHHIEVVHDSSWEKNVIEVEGEAASRIGHVAYVRRWANKVAQNEEVIYELLAARAAKENSPTCRVLWRRGERGARFVQSAPTLIGSSPIVECDEGSDASVDDFLGIENTAAHLEAKVASMLQMSAVRQETEDVRTPRRDGDTGGDSRVLVLRTSVSEAAREGLLDGNDGSKEGVDQ